MRITVIVELLAKPGERDRLIEVMDGIAAGMSAMPGFQGMARYATADEPDTIVEIANWESAEARAWWLDRADASGELDSLMDLLQRPPRSRVLHELE